MLPSIYSLPLTVPCSLAQPPNGEQRSSVPAVSYICRQQLQPSLIGRRSLPGVIAARLPTQARARRRSGEYFSSGTIGVLLVAKQFLDLNSTTTKVVPVVGRTFLYNTKSCGRKSADDLEREAEAITERRAHREQSGYQASGNGACCCLDPCIPRSDCRSPSSPRAEHHMPPNIE